LWRFSVGRLDTGNPSGKLTLLSLATAMAAGRDHPIHLVNDSRLQAMYLRPHSLPSQVVASAESESPPPVRCTEKPFTTADGDFVFARCQHECLSGTGLRSRRGQIFGWLQEVRMGTPAKMLMPKPITKCLTGRESRKNTLICTVARRGSNCRLPSYHATEPGRVPAGSCSLWAGRETLNMCAVGNCPNQGTGQLSDRFCLGTVPFLLEQHAALCKALHRAKWGLQTAPCDPAQSHCCPFFPGIFF
jgi:hypothetical protein